MLNEISLDVLLVVQVVRVLFSNVSYQKRTPATDLFQLHRTHKHVRNPNLQPERRRRHFTVQQKLFCLSLSIQTTYRN